MKRLFTLLRFVVTIHCSLLNCNCIAQTWFVVPDSEFVAFLAGGIPVALHGDSLNTSSPLVTGMTNMGFLAFQNHIKSLDGIQYFTSLNSLVTNNSATYMLNYIPSFPSSLQTIMLFNCPHLQNLPPLPASLTDLRCEADSLTSLPALPASLTILMCSGNPLYNLPPLPNSLSYLQCERDSLINLPALPNSLGALQCDGNNLTTLPALPDSLTQLSCGYNNIVCFPPFPNTFNPNYFSINPNPYTCLPNYVIGMDSFTLSHPLCSKLNVSSSNLLMCAGDSAVLTITPPAIPTASYTWSPATALSSTTGSMVIANPTVTINYLVSSANACAIAKGMVSVNIASVQAIISANPQSGYAPIEVQFTNQSIGATNYVWNYGNGDTQTTSSLPDSTTKTNYPIAGTYTVVMVASDTLGCFNTDTLIIIAAENYAVTIPNIFTPNGDNINDEFFIKGNGIISFNCKIFDR